MFDVAKYNDYAKFKKDYEDINIKLLHSELGSNKLLFLSIIALVVMPFIFLVFTVQTMYFIISILIGFFFLYLYKNDLNKNFLNKHGEKYKDFIYLHDDNFSGIKAVIFYQKFGQMNTSFKKNVEYFLKGDTKFFGQRFNIKNVPLLFIFLAIFIILLMWNIINKIEDISLLLPVIYALGLISILSLFFRFDVFRTNHQKYSELNSLFLLHDVFFETNSKENTDDK